MKNYKELTVWKNGIGLVKEIYLLSRRFPSEEKFALTTQITRAAVSIPANIAEGSSRHSDKDYARFLQIALGSAFELQTYFVIIKELSWIPANELTAVELRLEEQIKMLHGFIKKLTANG